MGFSAEAAQIWIVENLPERWKDRDALAKAFQRAGGSTQATEEGRLPSVDSRREQGNHEGWSREGGGKGNPDERSAGFGESSRVGESEDS